MKVQLDIENKTVKLMSATKLSVFVEKIKELLPDGLWKEYTLEISDVVIYNNYPWYWYGASTGNTTLPYWEPKVTCGEPVYGTTTIGRAGEGTACGSGVVTKTEAASPYYIINTPSQQPNEPVYIYNIEVED